MRTYRINQYSYQQMTCLGKICSTDMTCKACCCSWLKFPSPDNVNTEQLVWNNPDVMHSFLQTENHNCMKSKSLAFIPAPLNTHNMTNMMILELFLLFAKSTGSLFGLQHISCPIYCIAFIGIECSSWSEALLTQHWTCITPNLSSSSPLL